MTASITLDDREGLVAHIEGLQSTLTKRNARIRDLEIQLENALNGEPTEKALKEAYRRGWLACSARFSDLGREAEEYARKIGSTLRGIHARAYDHMQRDDISEGEKW